MVSRTQLIILEEIGTIRQIACFAARQAVYEADRAAHTARERLTVAQSSLQLADSQWREVLQAEIPDPFWLGQMGRVVAQQAAHHMLRTQLADRAGERAEINEAELLEAEANRALIKRQLSAARRRFIRNADEAFMLAVEEQFGMRRRS
jgi:hypothetical protein